MTRDSGADLIRVFVGTSADQRLAYEVLANSLRRNTRRPLQVRAIDALHLPVPRDPRNRMRTGFSFARFEIPRLCAFRGHALYLDADMLVLRDVGELWSLRRHDADLLYSEQPTEGAGARFSVMLLDCSRLSWSGERVVQELDAGRYSYEELMHGMCLVPEARRQAAIPGHWNSLDCYEPGKTALVHYTSVPTQPWRYGSHPHGAVWYRYLLEALGTGAVPRPLFQQEVKRGHVSPWLLEWAEATLGSSSLPGGA